MKYFLALAAFALTQGAPVVGKSAPPSVAPSVARGAIPPAGANPATVTVGKGKVAAAPPTPIDLSKLDANSEKQGILAMQVQSSLDNEADANGGSSKGTVVDLVLQSLQMNFTATCTSASKDYTTCANGYVSLDCVFQQSAASFGGVNCIPYLSQCSSQLLKFCQAHVPASEKCRSTTPCDCAQEAGCGWSAGHMMCLVNRDQVSCGDCPTMSRCGLINCPSATRPCDCVGLGGQCGWSTSNWRCESGKDTDCNECAEQTECGGPGVTMVHQDNCPATAPAQLASCPTVVTCSYDKKCCPRCAGSKQVCAETQAECDGQTWELRTSPLVCPNCNDYYYDDYPEDSPSEPVNITATQITQTSAYIAWKPPQTNFKAGVDGYSVAYAIDLPNDKDEKVIILNTTTIAHVALNNLVSNTAYKVSILPIANATESVGTAGTAQFKTLPAVGSVGKKKASAKGKVAATVTTPAAKAKGRR